MTVDRSALSLPAFDITWSINDERSISGRGLRFSLLSRIDHFIPFVTELIRGGQELHDVFGCHRVGWVALGSSPKPLRDNSSSD
jgi:hypothetical protein